MEPRASLSLFPRPFLWAMAALAGAALPSQASLLIEGISPRQVVTGSARFRVTADPPEAYAASLDEDSIPLNTWITVEKAGYFEARARGITPETQGESLFHPFVIRAPGRGSSETGLPPWTPPRPIPAHPETLSAYRLRLVAPRSIPHELALPVAARLENEAGDRAPLHAAVYLAGADSPILTLRRGVGSVTLDPPAALRSLLLRPLSPVPADPVQIQLETSPSWITAPARITANTAWESGARVRVRDDLEIAAGSTLTIGPGSILALDPGVDLAILGELRIEGSPEDPVLLTAADPGAPWGGAVVRGAQAVVTARGAFFTRGGADADWFSGSGYSAHRREQALFLFDDNTRGDFAFCWWIDNPGQALHGRNATLSLDHCLVQRAPTTGQFNGGSVRLTDSAIVEIPVDSPAFADDDNDGIYLTTGTHELTRTLIGWTKDDGIDAGSGNSGSVTVRSCWAESTFHEGFAWSGGGRTVSVANSVVLHCGQGVEAGFGEPNVTVTSSLVAGNLTGFRFGDNYDWDYNGFLTVRDSFSLFNQRNVWGRDWSSWEENLDKMDLQDNAFSETDPLHPSNAVWSPAADGPRLAAFTPEAAAPVGLGFAEEPLLRARDRFGEPLAVSLSGLCSTPVRVRWQAIGKAAPGSAAGRVLEEGVLEFPPGKLSLRLAPALPSPADETVVLVLQDTEGAVLTSGRALYYLPEISADDSEGEALVPLGSSWRYLDDGARPAPGWFAAEHDDAAWPSGQAELGYGDDDESTEIRGGPEDNRYPAYYFRHAFEVDDPAGIADLNLLLRRDDGAVVYLNGAEVFRSNMPDGEITPDTFALGSTSDENGLREQAVDPARLKAGRNVLAVEVHQSDAESSDVSFDLELRARRAGAPRWFLDQSAGITSLIWAGFEGLPETAPSLAGPWTPWPGLQPPVFLDAATASLESMGARIPLPEGQAFLRLRIPPATR